jgi:hypothetical protein
MDLDHANSSPRQTLPPARTSVDLMAAVRGVRLRIGLAEDVQVIAELAARDGAPPPSRPVLIAEADGRPRAALSLSSGAVVTDPSYPTTVLVDLLRERARELTG